jgi:hypothetical protein
MAFLSRIVLFQRRVLPALAAEHGREKRPRAATPRNEKVGRSATGLVSALLLPSASPSESLANHGDMKWRTDF